MSSYLEILPAKYMGLYLRLLDIAPFAKQDKICGIALSRCRDGAMLKKASQIVIGLPPIPLLGFEGRLLAYDVCHRK